MLWSNQKKSATLVRSCIVRCINHASSKKRKRVCKRLIKNSQILHALTRNFQEGTLHYLAVVLIWKWAPSYTPYHKVIHHHCTHKVVHQTHKAITTPTRSKFIHYMHMDMITLHVHCHSCLMDKRQLSKV